MKKKLKAKLDEMSKEQLVSLIERMCAVPQTERLLKLMLSPSRADIDRALRKFSNMCDYYACNSCSSRAEEAVVEAAQPLYAAYKYADDKTCAYIIYGMHEAMEENELLELGGGGDYDYILGDLLGDLRDILKHSPKLFSAEEYEKYGSIVEFYD